MKLNLSRQRDGGVLSTISVIFDRKPELLYKSPYINFLREFRLKRLDWDTPRLYRKGADAWQRLSEKEKKAYRYLDVIRAIKRRRAKKLKRAKMAQKRFQSRHFGSRSIRRQKQKPTTSEQKLIRRPRFKRHRSAALRKAKPKPHLRRGSKRRLRRLSRRKKLPPKGRFPIPLTNRCKK